MGNFFTFPESYYTEMDLMLCVDRFSKEASIENYNKLKNYKDILNKMYTPEFTKLMLNTIANKYQYEQLSDEDLTYIKNENSYLLSNEIKYQDIKNLVILFKITDDQLYLNQLVYLSNDHPDSYIRMIAKLQTVSNQISVP